MFLKYDISRLRLWKEQL